MTEEQVSVAMTDTAELIFHVVEQGVLKLICGLGNKGQNARRSILGDCGSDHAKFVGGLHQCPGSDVRIPLQHARVRTSEPKGHSQLYDSSVALDLTFLRMTRGDAGRNVKSVTLPDRLRSFSQSFAALAPGGRLACRGVQEHRSWNGRCRRLERRIDRLHITFRSALAATRHAHQRLLQQNLPITDSCTATNDVQRVAMIYSITVSARSRNDSGIVRPRALAVFRLTTSSNLVGCSTGRSAGLPPLRILST
jgi:hypothetical protein